MRKKLYLIVSLFVLSSTLALSIYFLFIVTSKDKTINEKNSQASSGNSTEKLKEQGIIQKASEILEIHFSYNELKSSKLEITEVIKKNGYLFNSIDKTGTNQYRVKGISNGNDIMSMPFEIPNTVIGAPPLLHSDSQPDIKLTQFDFVVTTLYPSDIDTLSVLGPDGETILTYPIKNISSNQNFPHVESSQGNVLSITSDIYNLAQQVTTRFVGDIRAQTTSNYVNIVFVSDGYAQNDLEQYKSEVNRMIEHLLTYEPIKFKSSQFIFHIIDNTSSLGCYYYGRAIICSTEKIISAVNSASVPYDMIAVVKKSSIYGGAAYYPTISNPGIAIGYGSGEYSRQVFAHEFGHAFAKLEDEYIANNSLEPGERNCFSGKVERAFWEQWTNDPKYIDGCNFQTWQRSSTDSIMKSITAEYFNLISQHYINESIVHFAGFFKPPTPTVIPTGEQATSTQTVTPKLTGSSIVSPTPTTGSSGSGEANCSKGISLSLSAATSQINAGSSTSTNLIVKNENDSGCTAATGLSITSEYPTNWNITLGSSVVSLSSGETKSIPITLSSSLNAQAGSYLYQLWVSSWGPVNGTVTVTNNVVPTTTVTPTSTPTSTPTPTTVSCNTTPSFSVSPNGDVYTSAGGTMSVTLSVTNNNAASCGSKTYRTGIAQTTGLGYQSMPTMITVAGQSTGTLNFVLTLPASPATNTYYFQIWPRDSTSNVFYVHNPGEWVTHSEGNPYLLVIHL